MASVPTATFQAPISQQPSAKYRLLTAAENEETILGAQRRIRKCGGCHEYARHTIATCTKRKENMNAQPVNSGSSDGTPSWTMEEVRQTQ